MKTVLNNKSALENRSESLSFSPEDVDNEPITLKLLIQLLSSSIYVLEISAINESTITLRLSVDQRGVELFVHKLIKTNADDVYKVKYDTQSLYITISLPLKKYSEVCNDFNYAFGKLSKYVEYKDLIAKFAPGYPNRTFPGYSFDDFDISSNGFAKVS